ncbi:MAG TPA: helix-turn-helix transcriptional regulator [Acidothermaceae bacterium]|jgi:transcriptional regulator with XRE-family HTH domain
MAQNFDLGEFIREQRRTAQISVRQLAKLAGVSNPYLSQIERGLRRPSAEIMQQIAKGLRISAEALYVQAGILDERVVGGAVVDAVIADPTITERQKHVLLEVYDSFRKENLRRDAEEATAAADSTDAVVRPVHVHETTEKAPHASSSAPPAGMRTTMRATTTTRATHPTRGTSQGRPR